MIKDTISPNNGEGDLEQPELQQSKPGISRLSELLKIDAAPTPSSREGELLEKLAAIEHERWADWQKWMHGSFYKIEKGNAIHQSLPQLLIERWERQIKTPYADLPDAEKQSDRDQVARYWPLITAWHTQQVEAAKENLTHRFADELSRQVAHGNIEPVSTSVQQIMDRIAQKEDQ